MRSFLQVVAVTLVTVLLCEAAGHLFYHRKSGKWMWDEKSYEVFTVRSLEFVQDDRVVTNMKSTTNADGTYSFDVNRFRIGKNQYSATSPNIVFLGDSVPFGWQIKGDDTVPSQFYELLQSKGIKTGVINAAIPSYSLHQAVARYREEIHGKFPVKLVILQVLDPAGQLSNIGKSWTTSFNWTTSTLTSDVFKLRQSFWYRYSSIAHMIMDVTMRHGQATPLDIDDTQIKQYFMHENAQDLSTLLMMVKQDNATLVLLPDNPASSYTKALQSGSTDTFVHAVDWLNTTLATFPKTHDHAYFLDVSGYFDSIGRDGDFIDNCCHLSPAGANKQSQFLYEQLSTLHLL